ncbi:hypothetical protein, partial [Streptomyces sp. NPDC005568]|uniref:hypothetical protein n=1 Tax=Streptomyces sp. NPDC005568 TaxID=3156887 RepID=UPI0033A45EC1
MAYEDVVARREPGALGRGQDRAGGRGAEQRRGLLLRAEQFLALRAARSRRPANTGRLRAPWLAA